MPIEDPSINPPSTAPFGTWKVRMLRGVGLTNVGQDDNEEEVFPLPHTSPDLTA